MPREVVALLVECWKHASSGAHVARPVRIRSLPFKQQMYSNLAHDNVKERLGLAQQGYVTTVYLLIHRDLLLFTPQHAHKNERSSVRGSTPPHCHLWQTATKRPFPSGMNAVSGRRLKTKDCTVC
jgi:hypothetical protein